MCSDCHYYRTQLEARPVSFTSWGATAAQCCLRWAEGLQSVTTLAHKDRASVTCDINRSSNADSKEEGDGDGDKRVECLHFGRVMWVGSSRLDELVSTR
jgi:hypothetical protein